MHSRPVPVSVLFVITFMTAGVGGSTKKVAFGVAYQLGYTIGNIIGPQTYRESDAPDYYVSLFITDPGRKSSHGL